MRRYPAIVLLLVAFSLSLLTPLLLAGVEQTNLPACCRRDGNHHCAKQMGNPPADGVQIAAVSVCPFFPSGKVTPAPAQLGAAPPFQTGITVAVVAENYAAPQSKFVLGDSVLFAWQQRGPPSLVS